MDALLPLAKCRDSRLRTSSGPGANTIFIEKQGPSLFKKVSALYIKTLRWYDLKLDARGIAALSIVEDYG